MNKKKCPLCGANMTYYPDQGQIAKHETGGINCLHYRLRKAYNEIDDLKRRNDELKKGLGDILIGAAVHANTTQLNSIARIRVGNAYKLLSCYYEENRERSDRRKRQ